MAPDTIALLGMWTITLATTQASTVPAATVVSGPVFRQGIQKHCPRGAPQTLRTPNQRDLRTSEGFGHACSVQIGTHKDPGLQRLLR